MNLLLNERLRIILILGFSSGLPLALSGSTLQAWYAITAVDITTIGFLSLVGQPYVFKFLWAPILDRYAPQILKRLHDRRKFWIVSSQLVLVLVIVLMSWQDPQKTPVLLGFLALMLAFASATQDIAIDAYRTDLLRPPERGLGAALSVAGYRVAMLVSGGLVLVLADQIGWHLSLLLMALLMSISLLLSYFSPDSLYQEKPPSSLYAAVVEPFRAFIFRKSFSVPALWFLLFIIIYKLGDAFAGTLTTTFLIRGAGFSLTEIGLATKTVGLAATLLGVFIGGLILYRKGLYFSLLWFGIFQAVTNLGFVVMAASGHDFVMMLVVIAMENLAGGMGTAAFVAFLTGLCDHRFSATQFALFSALSAVARVYVGPMAGYGVAILDWQNFYWLSFVIALPGLFLLYRLKVDIELMDTHEKGQ